MALKNLVRFAIFFDNSYLIKRKKCSFFLLFKICRKIFYFRAKKKIPLLLHRRILEAAAVNQKNRKAHPKRKRIKKKKSRKKKKKLSRKRPIVGAEVDQNPKKKLKKNKRPRKNDDSVKIPPVLY